MDEIEEIRIAFQAQVFIMRLDDLLPLRKMTPNIAASRKYARIKSSIGTIGMIEPLAIAPQETDGRRMLLDGHLRYHALRELGITEAKCIVADDDDSFTYNKRVNRLATVQEHYMIYRAIERGVPEEKIAAALGVTTRALYRRKGFQANMIKTVTGPSDLFDATSSIIDPKRRLELLVDVADLWIPPLQRRQRFIEDVNFDIGELRHGISDLLMRLPAGRLPCLLLDADGMIGTIAVDRPTKLRELDHDREVAVLNRSSGRNLITILEWTDVADGSFRILAGNVVGTPIELRDWRSDHLRRAGPIDNRWRGEKINLSDHGLMPHGPPGARFLAVSLSETVPSELAIVINTRSTTDPAQDWTAPASFWMSSGAANYSEARIGFITLQTQIDRWSESHTLLFDPCDPNVQRGLDQLQRQLCVHFIIADEAGEVVAFQGSENNFELDRLLEMVPIIVPGPRQNEADRIINEHRKTICEMLAPEALASAYEDDSA